MSSGNTTTSLIRIVKRKNWSTYLKIPELGFNLLKQIFKFITMINWNVIAQLTSLALVVLSGPAVIFLLYFKRGNL